MTGHNYEDGSVGLFSILSYLSYVGGGGRVIRGQKGERAGHRARLQPHQYRQRK